MWLMKNLNGISLGFVMKISVGHPYLLYIGRRQGLAVADLCRISCLESR